MYSIQDRVIRTLAETITGRSDATHIIKVTHRIRTDLHCDSLELVEVSQALETEFGIRVDDEIMAALVTVQHLVDYITNVCNEHSALPMVNPMLSLDALIMAESFLAGFEGDAAQEGIADKLAQLRTAITEERLRNNKITTLLRASMQNIMALDDAKNLAYAHGSEKYLEATRIIDLGHNACTALGYPYVAGEESPEDEIEQSRRLVGAGGMACCSEAA